KTLILIYPLFMNLFLICLSFIFLSAVRPIGADHGGWDTGHATFYGAMDGGETMGGACGYGNLFEQGYGLETAALSTALFNSGLSCGACFQILCFNDKQWCAPGYITITATNFCPPNYAKPNDNGGWCNPPLKHFDLSMPMFVRITKDYHAGIVPVLFRRVPCHKKGGIRFQMQGNQWTPFVIILNVGGAGDVREVWVKGGGGWSAMTRNWGQVWQTSEKLVGQTVSFSVTTSDGRTVQSLNVVPPNWQFGQTFEGSQF
ncbi:expansin-A2-like, partial [Phalaenopsis equestris]|uniref:expansin-A2-like n=1 Tax=Phalaenopsis equestris TaxID=78828 RepID=UPI0009E4D06A